MFERVIDILREERLNIGEVIKFSLKSLSKGDFFLRIVILCNPVKNLSLLVSVNSSII